MRKYIVGVLFLFCGDLFAQDASFRDNHSNFFLLLKDNSVDKITTLNWFQADTFGLITAQWRKLSGDYYQSQDAKKRRDLNFWTEGLKQVKKVRFYGAFSFEHFRADSVANTMQYGYEAEKPYYFFAIRKGTWNGVKYGFNGMLDWNVNETFHLMAGIKYKAENSWRSQDPRPEVFDQSQEYSIGLQYKQKKHRFAIGSSLIFTNLETNVSYSNDDLGRQDTDPSYTNYLMYGYGSAPVWKTDRNLYKSSDGISYQTSYAYDGTRWSFYVNSDYRNENEKVSQLLISSGSDKADEFGTVTYDRLTINALSSYKMNNHQVYSNLSYQSTNISDYNKKLVLNNYASERKVVTLVVGDLIYKLNRPYLEFNINAEYHDWYRKDRHVGVFQLYSSLNFNAKAVKYFYKRNGNQFQLNIETGYKFPLNEKLTIGENMTTAINPIVKHDYYFYNATIVKAAIGGIYLFPIQNLNFFAGGKLENQWAELPAKKMLTGTLPGNTRSFFHIRFGVFL
jgi:hypothetical protein